MSDDKCAQKLGIANFYKNKTIFITGATGFMGKVLLEKLLRSCPGIKRCYTLVRPKKGETAHERMEAVIKSKLYDSLRESMPDFSKRIVPVSGDIQEPGLGLSPEDEAMVTADTNVVFHSAATVKFNEELKLAVQMNVLGVRRIIELARKMTNLEALTHVSTAFSNCDKMSVKEMVYEPPLHPNEIIDAVEWMDHDAIQAQTSTFIGSCPNTYTYTKATAEYLLLEECAGLPVAMVRPSIVGASLKEPFPGWIDNLNGPTGVIAACGKGLLVVMQGNCSMRADMIPVDTAINAIIAVAWYTAVECPHEFLVYNCTSGQSNKLTLGNCDNCTSEQSNELTWGKFGKRMRGEINKLTLGNFASCMNEHALTYPCNSMVRVPNIQFTLNIFWLKTVWFFCQLMPAYVMDFYLYATGRTPMFVRIQNRLSKAITTLEYFTSNEWHFHNDNTFMLLSKMSEEDRQMFCFDPRQIDWNNFMLNYWLGVKQFILKEDTADLPRARRALLRFQRIQILLKVVAAVVICCLLVKQVTVFNSLWSLLFSWVQF